MQINDKIKFQLERLNLLDHFNSDKLLKVKIEVGSGVYEQIIVTDDDVELHCTMIWEKGVFEYELPPKDLLEFLKEKPFDEINSDDLSYYDFELIETKDGNLSYKKVNGIDVLEEDKIIESLKGTKYEINEEIEDDKISLIEDQLYELYNAGFINDSEYVFSQLFSLEFEDDELGSIYLDWNYDEKKEIHNKSQSLENYIQLISFTMIFMEFLDFTEKKSIDELHQLMNEKICNGDWELFKNCWEPGIDKFDSLKQGVDTYEDIFKKIENNLKNSNSYSEKQIIEFVKLCVELYRTYSDKIDFDGNEMNNRFELNKNHTHFNKLKFFQNLNIGFDQNIVFDNIFELVSINKKIQFFTHIVKGDVSDKNICFTNEIENGVYMSKYKYFEDCFEKSSQVMSLNYFDSLGKAAIDLFKNQILKLRNENISFFIQIGLVSNQKTILVYDDIISRRNKTNGPKLSVNSSFFVKNLIKSLKVDFFELVKNSDDYISKFSLHDDLKVLCDPNFSKIEEVDLNTESVDKSLIPEKLKDGKFKLHIDKSDFTLWEIEFEISNNYDREYFTFKEARKDFFEKIGVNPIEEEDDESNSEIFLSTEIQYFACDSGHGGNIINDCLVALKKDSPGYEEMDFEYRWEKLNYKNHLNESYLDWALEISSNGQIILQNEFLIGEDLSLIWDGFESI